MKNEVRWAWLVFWLMVSFSFQMPVIANEFEADIGGYVVAGHERYGSFYDEDGAESTSENVVRKVRLGLKLKYGDDWQLEIDGDFQYDGEEQTRELDDVWLRYEGFNWGDIQVGQMKEPFGFERLGGYSSLMTNERSLVTSAFAPGRSEGLLLSRSKKRYTWALGVFRESSDDNSARAITGRVTFAPIRTAGQAFHVGLASSWRDLRKERFQIRESGELYTADNVIRSPRFDADELAVLGGELAWSGGPVTLIAEGMAQRVTQTNGEVWHFSGGYLQAGWMLTGERRKYDKGEFDRIKPNRDAGAVELVARWSGVDLREQGVGANASVALLGLNYYWRKTVLVRVNYLIPTIEGNALMANPDGNAVTVRAQVRF